MKKLSPVVTPELAEIDELLSTIFRPDAPGAAAIVAKAGQPLLRKGYGLANLEWTLPVTPDTAFRIGSVTKQFTAVSVLMLMEQGKLDLQDPIQKFFPGYPTQGHTITIEHLLTHTSGIKSYTGMKEWKPAWGRDFEINELIDFFKFQPMDFAPGQKYAYNNSAYVLLGAIIEKVSGLSYGQFLAENIFKPLEMKQTFLELPGRIIPKRAAGYSKGADGLRNADYISMTQPQGAGGIVSSVEDLVRWDAALYENRLLSAESLKRAQTPYHLADGSSTHYGYGWAINTFEGMEFIEHGGGIHGFACFAIRVPHEQVYAAVLTNSDSHEKNLSDVAFLAVTQILGFPYRMPPVVAMAPKRLSELAGVYQIEDGPEVNIFQTEDGLAWNNPGSSDRERMVPLSETEFTNPDSYLNRVHFIRAESGQVSRLEIKNQYGVTFFKAARTEKALPE